MPKTRPGRGWRIVIWMLMGVVLLLGMGAVYQMVGTAVDRRTYTPSGQLVDVGGYKMHIYCMGEGSPTVILDHVGAANSAEWALIQPVVAAQARVCAYDRAGFGWSEPSPDPQDAEHNAQQLHSLLTNAGVEGPFVFAGHSFGAGDPFNFPFYILSVQAMLLYRPRLAQEQLQTLAVAGERNRLARDLHDSAKQQAFALSAQLGAVRSLSGTPGSTGGSHA